MTREHAWTPSPKPQTPNPKSTEAETKVAVGRGAKRARSSAAVDADVATEVVGDKRKGWASCKHKPQTLNCVELCMLKTMGEDGAEEPNPKPKP
jgi:hypothetical protein